ncbi:GntR family transcriptional regulator [Mycobacterium antarcticum]|nr:GntR family transcriptional regulator [Mycolicibacterium sp. TUM20985]GLP75992.1 GntR family transcriptional regulator [Mycolicibacterium sp. TUM20983]GLP83662.1 GntR family transcriptional regulator [Mycolicibacterium sp. TUM20984]
MSARRTAEIVAEELRRQILDGELADGDLLPRQDILVDRFKVSLVSLREALRILETEGLISVRRGNRGGAVVHAPANSSAAYMLGLVLQSDSVRLTDLGRALQELEPSCAAMAATRQDRATTLVPVLVALNDLAEQHLDDGSRFTDIGRQFHHEIAMGCGNHTMAAVMGSLEALWSSHERQWAEKTAAQGEYPSLGARRTVHAAHVKLTAAIEAGDVERARRLAARHAADTQTYVVADDPDQRVHALPAQVMSRTRRS